MFEIQNYTSFVVAILVFQLVPGAGAVAILNATARNGVGAGLGAVAGTLLGDFIYMLAAVLGLATVMQAYPLLFTALQWFGVAYLCWLGIHLLRSPILSDQDGSERQQGKWVHFHRALAVSLTNPKVMLFFVALFPLFLRPDASPITLGAMMVHVTVISFAYQLGLVLLGKAVTVRLSVVPAARKAAARLAGVAVIGFGVKLALANR